MNGIIVVALISAFASVLAVVLGSLLIKRNERMAEWRKTKLAHYQEFFTALGSIVGTDVSSEAHTRFAVATNTLHLIASKDVIEALHAFRDEIRISNRNRSGETHDRLLRKLTWEIRKDLGTEPTSSSEDFPVRLWVGEAPPKEL